MATLSFEGESHDEIVQKVRRWLSSVDGATPENRLTTAEAISQGAELTKEALRVIAQAAPAPVAQSDLFKSLTNLGYKATDTTKTALLDGLDSLEQVTGGSVVRKATETGRSVVYQMSESVARAFLKSLTGTR
jgi:hypothetical protein